MSSRYGLRSGVSRLFGAIMLLASIVGPPPLQAAPGSASATVAARLASAATATPTPSPAPSVSPTSVAAATRTAAPKSTANAAPRLAGGPATFTVTASGGWVSTGLTINVGDVVTVTASGTWNPGPPGAATGPDGEAQSWPDNYLNRTDIGVCAFCARTNTPHWAALVGYIGSNPPGAGSYTSTSVLPDAQRVFPLGSSIITSAAFSGTLWLGFNDDAYSGNTGDNSGSVSGTVTITPGTVLGIWCPPYQGCSTDPVDTASGNFPYQHTDVAISGRGGGITFQRTYNSEDSRTGPLGPGWTHSYNAHVVDNGTSVQVVRGDGRTDIFGLQGTSYVPPQGVFDTLQKFNPAQPDGTVYLLTRHDLGQLGFDTNGRLIYLKDRYGSTTALTYNGSGQLTTITDPAGRGSLTLGYDPTSGLLVSVTDWASPARTVHYGYAPAAACRPSPIGTARSRPTPTTGRAAG